MDIKKCYVSLWKRKIKNKDEDDKESITLNTESWKKPGPKKSWKNFKGFCNYCEKTRPHGGELLDKQEQGTWKRFRGRKATGKDEILPLSLDRSYCERLPQEGK